MLFLLLSYSAPEKTASRENDFHQGPTGNPRRVIQQNKISRHFHEGRSRNENKPSRKQSAGILFSFYSYIFP